MNTPKVKTALVTGASRGIGRAAAEALAASGATVAVHYANNTAAADETVSAIRTAGGNAFPIRADLAEPGSVDAVVDTLLAELRQRTGRARLDAVVHNAAVTTSRSLDETTPEDLDRIWNVNVRAPFLLTKALLPVINDGGRVVFVSSAATRIALPELAYAMSKGAIEVLARTLANHVGLRSITVNAVAPGPTMTDTNPWMASPDAQAMVAAGNAIERVGMPEDIAAVIAFLVSDAGGWVTGQIIDASGGCYLGPKRIGAV
jgi:NAD(P)-dependent dehydrogenase (short-subunit alcohol dehydrogenase family)